MYKAMKAMRFPRAVAPVFIVLATATALAEENVPLAKAYTYAAEGLQAYDEGRAAEALAKFSAAYSIVRLPSIALFMARAESKLGHLIAASKLCDEAIALQDSIGDPDVQRRAREEAKAEREALNQRTPRLIAVIAGAPVSTIEVKIDANAMSPAPLLAGLPLDPGIHSVIATSGSQERQLQVSLVEHQATTITFEFTPPPVLPEAHGVPVIAPANIPAEETNPLRTASWVSFGVGGAALALWGTTGLWAMSKSRDLDKGGAWQVENCAQSSDNTKCIDYRHLRTFSTVSFYTGIAGVVTGTTLFIMSPKSKSPHRSGVRLNTIVGFGSVNIEGTF